MSYQGTITSKGQTTIPKEVRKKLKLKPGDRIYWILEDDQAVLRPKTGSILDLAGMLHRPGQKPATIEEMNSAIADAAAESAVSRVRRSK
jgi:AbrB family looped-hinge helix DNA binding protein